LVVRVYPSGNGTILSLWRALFPALEHALVDAQVPGDSGDVAPLGRAPDGLALELFGEGAARFRLPPISAVVTPRVFAE
jgi:hypothetical protein